MDRKEIAKQTLEILQKGYYFYDDKKIDIAKQHRKSVEKSLLITPEEGERLLQKHYFSNGIKKADISLENIAVVKAVLDCTEKGREEIGVLNFASAKNPGGGFLNGAMAQEESIAASSGLYETLLQHKTYYEVNRQCGTMIYTDYAIYSPDVVFFRDEKFSLLQQTATASVLTLPAVNYGQVLLKKENEQLAKKVMKKRMELALAIFVEKRCKTIILGAYGCGVFRNVPSDVAKWWQELLKKGYDKAFETILFAVLDGSQKQAVFSAFEKNINI